ncbi:Neuronal calcium sensor 1 [Brachionus plicatilis]|uniref:Neuronal calcium sensor 1 n=1 Tax=Brachionus plicatilis TaxID=10195 RepID=A0A3M7S2S7_BRAPC|nr:Neuronal calcium sensor 1 [Brachionus plicatilis]
MGNKKVKEVKRLSEDDILHLCYISEFSREEILFYYQSFITDCPAGKLSKKDFQKMYEKIYPQNKSTKFSSRIFEVYDRNKDGYLDFEEFLRANKITTGNDINEKLKMAFEIYDLKNDGVLDKNEMVETISNIFTMAGIDKKNKSYKKLAEEKVDIIYRRFNLKKDNFLTLEEFIQCYLSDENLKNILSATFLEKKSFILQQPKNYRELQLEAIQRVLSM